MPRVGQLRAVGTELAAVLVAAAAAAVYAASVRVGSHGNLLGIGFLMEVMVSVFGCDHIATTGRVTAAQRWDT